MRQTTELWQRARQGDRNARERLIELHMPLARSLAVQYRHAREPLDDLCQVANLGLVKAVDRYDPDRGIAFTSYAVPTILGELKRHFRDRTWTIHVSRSVQESIARVERISEDLRQELGRWPNVNEVAAVAEMSVEEVTEARLAEGASRLASPDAARGTRRRRPGRAARPRGRRAGSRRGRPVDRAAGGQPHSPPARGAAPALRRGPRAARDRRARRAQPDARVADPARHARAAS